MIPRAADPSEGIMDGDARSNRLSGDGLAEGECLRQIREHEGGGGAAPALGKR